MSNPPLTPFGSALAGALGAVFSNAVVYPLDTVKTRIQALPAETPVSLPTSATETEDAKRKSPTKKVPRGLIARVRRFELLQMLIRIIRTEGISGAFKGFTANMINTFSMQFAYFFFHTLLRTALLTRLAARSPHQKALSTSSELLVGAAAGGLAQIFTIPVSVIATRQQIWTEETASSSTSSTGTKDGKRAAPSLLETGREIVAESGITGLWTGLKPGLVLTVNPAITYGVFERLKTAVLARQGRATDRLEVMESFWLGVSSKAIATVVTYPYIFAKVRLQAQRDDPRLQPIADSGPSYATIASQPPTDDSVVVAANDSVAKQSSTTKIARKERGAIPLLLAVYKQKGLAGWYQGLTAQLLKAALCQGILFVSKDQFERWAWIIIAALSTLRKRITLRA